jgi:hypothetical protein
MVYKAIAVLVAIALVSLWLACNIPQLEDTFVTLTSVCGLLAACLACCHKELS